MSLLVETAQRAEKFIYDWRLDKSSVADVTAARKVLPNMPQDTSVVTMDPAYDARDVYTMVEDGGARPAIKPRAGYSLKSRGHSARPRALRWLEKHKTKWQDLYDRRPISESANYSLKKRFGERLDSHGVWQQRKEQAFRVLVYNGNMSHRRKIRRAIQRGEL